MNFKENESTQKLRGGYYTPVDLATFIAQWVAEIEPRRVLEPSCGDGAFFSAFSNAGGFEESKILGFELEDEEASKASIRAKELGLLKTDIISEDFLGWALNAVQGDTEPFDAIVGNPPFIRYQYLPSDFQITAERVFEALDSKFTRHTNAWVPFILASVALLRPGGRLGMVVPSELLHVTHAQSLRTYLGEECNRLVVIDPNELWFDNTLQGAVILLAEKKMEKTDVGDGLGIYPVRNREFLSAQPSDIFAFPKTINGQTVEGKWTRALLDIRTRKLLKELEAHKDVHTFDDIAKVEVGIVTGANKFFLVDDDTVRKFNLQNWAHPMFGRSDHCPGVIYDNAQHQENAMKGKPTNFLWFDESSFPLSESAKAYIELGEAEKLHKRFKCRVRTPWYKVPSVHATEIGMLKRCHNAPRLILNTVGAYTTDTAYRVFSEKFSAAELVSNFINPLTALCAELEGRSYGGGVLELVPSEIRRLKIPIPKTFGVGLDEVNSAIKSEHMDDVLKRQGLELFGKLGLNQSDSNHMYDAWNALRNRRQRTRVEIAKDAA